LIAIKRGTKMRMVNGREYSIGPPDAIYEKTAKVIEPGDIAHGWIQANFRNITSNELVASGARWEITFVDHTGTRYTASYEYRGNEVLKAPSYYPGAGIKP